MYNFKLLQKVSVFSLWIIFFNYKDISTNRKGGLSLVEGKINLRGSLSSERDQYYYIMLKHCFLGGFLKFLKECSEMQEQEIGTSCKVKTISLVMTGDLPTENDLGLSVWKNENI